jgi:hypothetical protein
MKFDFRGLMSTELNLLCDQNTLNELSTLLRHDVLNVEHYCLITELTKGIRTAVIGHLYNSKFEGHEASEGKDVWQMSTEGKGKVR